MDKDSEILKILKEINQKVSSASANQSVANTSNDNNKLDNIFIKQSDAAAVLYKRSHYDIGADPMVFTALDIENFEADGTREFNRLDILDLHKQNVELTDIQMSHNNEKNKLNDIIDEQKVALEQLSEANKFTNSIIDEVLNIDFIKNLDNKSVFIELAIMLKSLNDKGLPDLYRDNISANDKQLVTLFHISYLICSIYNNKDLYNFDLANINAIIQHVNSTIDSYEIEQYSNSPDQVFDSNRHETDDNSPFKIAKFITLPIYLKGRLDEEPVKKGLVKTDS